MRRPALKALLNAASPYLFLLAEVLLFHRRVLFSLRSVIPFDIRGYHLPLAFFASENLGMGRLPLWDPYIYCGFPFYGNINTQLFYPAAWPFFALGNVFGLDRLGKVLDWQTALHIFLGGVFAYWLLRKMNLRRGSALTGATIYQLGGFFSSQTQHLGAICGAAWLPLAWLGVLSLAQGFSWRWLAILSAALAMSFLAGFPATTIVVFGSAIFLAILMVVLRRAPISLLASTAAACAWAALLSAVQLIPTLTLSPISQGALRAKWAVNGGSPLQALVSLVLPNHYHIFNHEQYTFPYNLTFMYLYCSIAGLLLAVLAIVLSRHKFASAFALLTVICCAWTVIGNVPVIGKYYALIPAAIRGPMYPDFASAAFVLGMGVMAAFGAERLVAPRGRIAMAALVVIVAVDLTAVGSGRYMNTARVNRYEEVTTQRFEGSAENVTRMRELTGKTFPRARFDVIDDSINWTSSPQILHLQTASGNEPLALQRILKLRGCFGHAFEWERYYPVTKFDSKLLDLMNVRYLLAWGGSAKAPSGNPHIPRLEIMERHFVYENPDVLPRFFLVSDVRRTRTAGESLAAVCGADFEPARQAVVEGDGDLVIPRGPERLGSVSATRYAPNNVVLEVEARAPAFLVTSETFYPGWRAEVNGREERIWMTNGAFRGLRVPAGHSRVTMTFRPPDLMFGAALSVLGCALLGWVIRNEARRRGQGARP